MSWEGNATCTIPFHDADPMGLVWHGHTFKYFELARTDLLQRIDYDYPTMTTSGYVWPIIECKSRFLQPIRYGMTISIAATLVEYQHRLKIDYLIRDAATDKRLTRGTTTQVALRADTYEMCMASPRVLLDKLGVST